MGGQVKIMSIRRCLSKNFNHQREDRYAEEESGLMHKNGKGIWCIKKESNESANNMENTHCSVFHPTHNAEHEGSGI